MSLPSQRTLQQGRANITLPVYNLGLTRTDVRSLGHLPWGAWRVVSQTLSSWSLIPSGHWEQGKIELVIWKVSWS
jgi:hypothetical protein